MEKSLGGNPVTIRSVIGFADMKKKTLRECFPLRLLHHTTSKIEAPLLGIRHS